MSGPDLSGDHRGDVRLACRILSSPRASARGENLTITEHTRIYEAIAGGDPDAAETAMRDHLTRANALYRQLEETALAGAGGR